MGKDREEIGKKFRKLGKIVRKLREGFVGFSRLSGRRRVFSGRG
jgi:hypothetical protein